MNYYDELGIEPDSSAKQIHRAYRSLARRLHPDNFQDEERRRLAEEQMQHLNEILGTLIHPGKRQDYDESLGPHTAVMEGFEELITEPWESPLDSALRNASNHWFSILSVSVIASAGLWYWTSGRTPLVQLQPYEMAATPSSRPPTRKNTSPKNVPELAGSPTGETKPPPQTSAQATAAQHTTVELVEPPAIALDPAPVTLPVHSPALPQAPPAPSLSGLWLFVPPKPRPEATNVYSPEYIELLLLEGEGKIVGKYTARYRIPDRPISPEVNFRLEGKVPANGKPLNLNWSSADGAEGEAIVNRLTATTLEIKWWTSKLGRPGTLASGSSQLVKQQSR